MNSSSAHSTHHFDVIIIGGGPAGSTLGTLLRKYDPKLKVLILEKEKFPREHVGESQLPPISKILNEMGCWDKVEAANFPIKIGATYRWGSSAKLWDFEFLPVGQFEDEPRPAKYQGQRLQTAFQVERAVYDEILLNHAETMGCEIKQQTRVTRVESSDDAVTCVATSDGDIFHARYFVDASGSNGILRKAMEVPVSSPTSLQNIAIYDYWENAEWAVEIGVGGTRVQVMSIGTGWLWFIPLSPTKTSIGFICPASYRKAQKESPEQLYLSAIRQEPRIAALTENATRKGDLKVTKDWSFLAERMVGDNWFLAGESAGFADPILAAGMTLAHSSARELAYTILELDRGEHDSGWLKRSYQETQQKRINQHIRFADFWYSANGQFADLQEYTSQIARDAGLNLSPQKAFQWLGTGGFTNDVQGQAGIGGLDLAGVKQVTQMFTAGEVGWEVSKFNRFKLNVKDTEQDFVPTFANGRIKKVPCYKRKNHVLIVDGVYALAIELLKTTPNIADFVNKVLQYFSRSKTVANPQLGLHHTLQALEVMVVEGWVTGKFDRRKPKLKLSTPKEGEIIHFNTGQ
ncbi:MAG: NAD(P)/FAD-dependent oxidoreductase [Gammaproteobacteria bacterium]|nr:NAD(P)/FAD-dependent oxidoreductase [Gammaproteobacteria bacterium]